MRSEPDALTPEQAFAAFRRRGDGRALAAAFDATAPELLRVAAFLVPRDDVEDLLHQTFGTAMARGSAYDASRPLLPWLLGILANEARTLRRRARMRRRDRDARSPAAARDPVAAASDRETAAAFAGALQELSHDDASLLRQHLLDDLSCREIAARAHKPAGTVRTQVARAMGELRRRLPVGLAVAPGFGDVGPRALANVRARLLAGSPAIAVAGGLWLRARWWLVTFCATASVAAVVLFAPRTEPAATGPVVADVGGHVVPAHGDGSTAAPPTPVVASTQRESMPAAAPAWRLRGTVRANTGEPLPHAVVRCQLFEMGPVVAEAPTDAEGRYELDLAFWRDRPPLDRSGNRLVAVAEAPGRDAETHFASLPSLPVAGPLLLAHDFELAPYVTLWGRVVDRFGQPVPARLNAFGVGPDEPLHAFANADDQGQFRLALREGLPRVRIDARHAVAGRSRFEVELPPGGERDLGDVVLAPGHAIRGRVALLDGTPVPDIEVNVRGGLRVDDGLPQVGPNYWYFETRTDDEGRFAANRSVLDRWEVYVTGPLGMHEDFVIGHGGRWLPAEADTVDLRLDGVRVDLSWSDSAGRSLLPRATQVVVFAADAGDAAAAARGGDATALQRALADEWTRAPHVVVPRGAFVWLRADASGGFGADELVQMPMQNGAFAVDLRLAETPATLLTVRARFADGGVPADFTCSVQPQAGASLRAFEVLRSGPGEVHGTCAVGPVRVEVAAYPETFDKVVESRVLVTEAGRENELDIVLARRGRIRFVLRDASAPDRVTDEGIDGEVTIGTVRAGRFFWQGGTTESASIDYWGSPPLGHPVESMAMVPVGRTDVRFEFEGYQPVTLAFDVTEAAPAVVSVWLQPR